VTAEQTLIDERGNPLTSREFTISPKIEGDFLSVRRTVKSDELGRIKVDRIVPGLTYHVQEEPPVQQRLPGGGFIRRRTDLDRDMILVPERRN
jgi:hypothetical protein